MSLADYLAVLRRRLLAGLLCLIAGGIGGYYVGHQQEPLYQATSRSLVSLPETLGSVNAEVAGAQLSGSYLTTYAQVASSRSVAEKVVRALQLPESPGQLQGKLSASVQDKTFLINITAVDADPVRAKSLADAAAVALSERVEELNKDKNNPVTSELLDLAQVPGVPFSPRPTFNLVLGIALGLAVGLGLMALLEALDRSVKSSAQGDAVFQAPLLAIIPRRRARRLAFDGESNGIEGEPYRALRTAVQFANPDVPLRTILVTSASPGDGKTTTAANLALALAASGDRVVIIDADLRRARLAEMFGLEGAVGLSSLVLRSAEIDEALQVWGERLSVLPSGRPLPPNPSEVLGSQFMSHLLEELAGRFDVVVLDTPPVLPVTDAVALATLVDAVLLVARHGTTHRGPAAEARRRLDSVGAPVIGYVLNAVPARESAGYYVDYRYGYR